MSNHHTHSGQQWKLALAVTFMVLMQFPAAISAGSHPRNPGEAKRSSAGVDWRTGKPTSGDLVETQSDLIRQISLTTNDVVYSPATKMLYASVPSSVGVGGNSIRTIDPATTATVSSTFIGSEPDKLALADDGHTLYSSLAGAYSIRSFDVLTQTPGAQFAVGADSFFGVYSVADLAVAPGNPNLVAVARNYLGTSPPEAGVVVFDNGVQRPVAGPGHTSGSDYLAFSASPTKLYGTGIYGGLETMTIDSSGVTITTTTSFASGNRIKFDNGVIYSANGQKIDPAGNGTLLGTFPSTFASAFVPDSTAGRAYYLTSDQFSGGNYTLKAFDINTFLSVGTLAIPGVVGTPTSMVRWGANGLAFRTTGGQLFIIQTSLIPSAEPIPSPSPTPTPSPSPSPTPPATFVRQLSLATNDLIYRAADQKIYASVPGSAGIGGNTITPIDPVAGSIGSSAFVGSEPTKLALSDDGQSLYVGLNGAAAVRRFDLSTQMAGLQFSLGNDSFNGPRVPSDIAVMPGSPGTVAVNHSGGTAVYDDGVQRPQTVGNGGSLAFGSPSILYVGNVQKLAVSAAGLSLVKNVLTASNGNIVYNNGLVYMSGGAVVDVEAGVIKGKFNVGFGSLMAVDSANSRVFFLNNTNGWVLRSFDINTFLPLASVPIPDINGTPTSLVRWGTNGLAFRVSNGRVFLIQSALVNASDPVPTPTPTPSPTPSPSPAYIPTFVKKLDLQGNDLVYNQSDQSVYASVPSSSGSNGNSIAKINPQTGVVGPTTFVGSEPNKLALSDNGQTLYVNLDGAQAVRRFDIPTLTPGLQFSTGVQQPVDMEVMPGSPQTLAVPIGSSGVGIFDDGVKRPNTGQGNFYSIGPIEFNGASTIYGYDSYSSGFELVKFSVNASGANLVSSTNNLLAGYLNGLKFSNGLLYSAGGRVVDPEAKKLIGTYPGIGFTAGALAVDQTTNRIFFLSNPSSSVVLTAYDLNTFVLLGSVTLVTGVQGQPSGLVRWGTNGLAFRVARDYGSGPSNPSYIYLAQSALVSTAAPIPTGIQLGASTFNPFEGSSNFVVTVTRTGDVSGSSSIDYASSDGTATAGSDYTTTNGTLTFAAGELSKTIPVPILDDNVYEGPNETFNFSLSNPSAGTTLNSPSTAVMTISDSESKPSVFGAFNASVVEGNAGSANAAITVTLSNASYQTITVDYATGNGTATAGSDYTATSGTLTFPPGTISQTINVPILGDTVDEPDETFLLNLSNATNVSFISGSQTTVTIINDDGPPKLQFSASAYQVSEGAGAASITVTRFGKATDPVGVDYQTSDGSALQSKDYTIAAGTLHFAAGESSKTFEVVITDDAFIENNEFINLTLSNPTGTGASLGAPTFVRLTIQDNDTLLPPYNPIDDAQMFVRQHYADFLSRQPDPGGLSYWTSQITQCGTDALCARTKRMDVSNSFFYELEYQQTGSYVYRLYRVAYGNNQPSPNPFVDPNYPNEEKKLPSYAVFATDRARVTGGALLAQSQLDLAIALAQRSQFLVRYPASLDGPGFVDAVLATINNDLGVDLTSQRQALIDQFNAGGRGAVLYRLADDNAGNPINNRALIDREYDRAFVFTQYAGYLRRNADLGGFLFWLGQVDNAPLRDVARQHAMVCSFITATEYQLRFSNVVTHTNAECQ